jgi:molybdopterin synthase sulfur carrier subunit
MRVIIPSPLLSYTNAREVEASGATLDEVLVDLDRRFPGIRFRVVDEQGRVRRHMRFFVSGVLVEDLGRSLSPEDELFILQALSGG